MPCRLGCSDGCRYRTKASPRYLHELGCGHGHAAAGGVGTGGACRRVVVVRGGLGPIGAEERPDHTARLRRRSRLRQASDRRQLVRGLEPLACRPERILGHREVLPLASHAARRPAIGAGARGASSRVLSHPGVKAVEFRDDRRLERARILQPRLLEGVRVRVEQHGREVVVGGHQHVACRPDPHVVGEAVAAHRDRLDRPDLRIGGGPPAGERCQVLGDHVPGDRSGCLRGHRQRGRKRRRSEPARRHEDGDRQAAG